ncbi:MAG: hypothetical protein KJZ69_18090 [Phycisphaerales bacterium]|nr:hypothetical protein [Phycisphaerales bacterium]
MATRHDVVDHPSTAELIKSKARQLCRRSDFSKSDLDEFEQEMHTYVWRKSHLYDPDRGSIEAFVTTALKSWVGMELRRCHRHKRWNGRPTVSIDRSMIECEGVRTPLLEVLVVSDGQRHTFRSCPAPLDLLILQERVRHGLAQLTPEERDLLHHVAEHGVARTSREWTRRLGRPFSRRQVGNEMLRIRRKFEDPRLSGQ